MITFSVRVHNRRWFVITQPGPCLVDCRDTRTGFESQAIVDAATSQSRTLILADSQVRDAIRSAYHNATSHESGRYPVGGERLPEDFTIELI
jgi:hypothetical protein